MKLRVRSTHDAGSLINPGAEIGPDPGFDFLMRIEPSTRYFGGTSRVSANPMLLPTAMMARMSHLYLRIADENRPSCSVSVVDAGAIGAGGPQAAPPG
jgi:hypothetical protein